MHRARQGFVKARTSPANQIRGLLSTIWYCNATKGSIDQQIYAGYFGRCRERFARYPAQVSGKTDRPSKAAGPPD
jgi:hypothetical protein